MNINLISYTNDARELLIFSKKTRLLNSPKDYEAIKALTEEEKAKEIDYVFSTIGSSWEFVDYVFLIQGVTRAFTHQLVRHRVGVSFAQQAMRVVDASGFDCLATGACIDNPNQEKAVSVIRECYSNMIKEGVNPQDARGILPTNIKTNILMKINLRSLSGLLNVRLCYKAQGEFQMVARELRRIVIDVHPWAYPVLQVNCAQHGSCIFPNYKDCPIKESDLIPVASRQMITELWEKTHCEVQPKGERTDD